MTFDVESHPKGFENSLTMTGVVQNGSFLNSGSVPQIGYQEGNELSRPQRSQAFQAERKGPDAGAGGTTARPIA